MACWPANTTGAFFIALLLYDVLFGRWADLPLHSILGIILTALFWLICASLGTSVSGAILIVPAVYLCISLLISEYDEDCGCCSEIPVPVKVPESCPPAPIKATPIPPKPKCKHTCQQKHFRNSMWH